MIEIEEEESQTVEMSLAVWVDFAKQSAADPWVVQVPKQVYLKPAWVFLHYSGLWRTDNLEHATGQGGEESHYGLWPIPLLFLEAGLIHAS